MSVRYTLRAKAPTEGTDNTRSADACLSFARVAFNLCVVVKWSGHVQQGIGVQLLTVEEECLSLGTDVKHSEVHDLFSIPNASRKFCEFPFVFLQQVSWNHNQYHQRFTNLTFGLTS